MASTANQVQELGLRTFIETWVEPVLRAMIKLEALYETDDFDAQRPRFSDRALSALL